MSKQIDERVVSMQFDNKRFESNVQTSMSTLDKLKQKLNLTGASKGLENVQTASKKVDMSGLSNNVETVRAKFSALEVMGVTALANITNSAVNAGKRIVSALTIQPVTTGLSEYETQINAVQTIMANVGHKGKTLDDVNKALEELNKYADQTIYNFTEMTKNIGLFTNAGAGLDESVAAIKGFSNAAAMAGADSTRTAGAMYQLSQAMSSGKVLLRDWMSLEQANVTGERFQETIKMTARAHGINIDAMIEKQGSLRDTLKDGWLTADLMAEALNHYTLSTEKMTEAEQEAAKAKLKSNGYTDDQIEKLFQLGTEATNAATQVKTFSQLWGVLQESAQSGWSKSWQIIIGDFEEAKSLLTPLGNALTGVIDRMSDWRNKILTLVFDNPFQNIIDKINDVTKVTETVANATKDYGDIVDRVISGEFGNTEKRWNKLTEMGYDWAHVQNLVNEKLGNSYRRTTQYKEAQEDANKTQAKTIAQLLEMSDAQLKNIGFEEDEIRSLRELEKQAEKTGIPLEELIKDTEQLSGRNLLINAFKNLGTVLSQIGSSAKAAWKEIFPGSTAENIASALYNAIAAFHKFAKSLAENEENAGKFTRVFKGVFSLLKLVFTLVGGPIKIAFKILSQLLGAFGVTALDVAAYVGDLITKFSNWLDRTLDLSGIFEKAVPHIKKAAAAVKEWFVAFKDSKAFQVGKNIIQGLLNGISSGVKTIAAKMLELGSTIIEKICSVLGIHSPSTKFFDIGTNIIAGLFDGISESTGIVWDLIKAIGGKIVDIVKELNFQKVIGVAVGAGLGVALFKVLGIVKDITTPLREFGELIDSAQDVLDQTGDAIKRLSKAKAFELKSEAVLNFAKAIGILAASIAALALLPKDKLWGAVAAMLVLVGVIVGLTVLVMKMSEKMADLKKADLEESISFGKIIGAILGLSVAMVIIATAIKKLSFLNKDNVGPVLLGVLATIGTLVLLLLACKALSKIDVGGGIDEVGTTLLKISIAMLLMATLMKIIGKMKPENMTKGLIGIAILSAIMVGLMAATKLFSKDATKIGSTLMAISGAITMLALVMLLLGMLKPERVKSGLVAISALSAIVVGLMIAVKYFAKGGTKIAGTLMGIAGAIGILAMIVVVMSLLKPEKMAVGMIAVGLLGGLIIGLLAAVKAVDGGGGVKIAASILGIAVAIGILAAVAVALSLIKIGGLVKGIVAVGLLSGLAVGLMYATKGSEKCEKSILAMAAAIAILAVAIAILSKLDIKGLAAGTVAMAIVMGMLALMIKASGSANQAIGSLIVITAAMTLMAVALMILAKMPVENTLAAALALSLTLAAMSGVLYALGKMSSVTGKALLGVIGLTLLAVPMLAFVCVLYLMQGIQNASINVVLLAGLITVCAILLPILALCGGMWIPALIGIACLTAMAVPMLAFVGVLALMQNIPNAQANAELLMTLMTTMVDLLVKVALVGPLAVVGVTALTMLSGLMVAMGVLAVAVGALMQKFPALESFLDTGIPILVKLANGVGQVIGALIAGFAITATAALPIVGMNLGLFMINAMPFITGAKQIDESVLTGIAILSGAIIALTAAELLAGITSFLTGGASFGELGSQLSTFMLNALPFIAGAMLINDKMISGVKALAEAILIITAANLLEGIASFLTGGSSFDTFAQQLPILGEGLNAFAASLEGFTPEQLTVVTCAAIALRTLAQAAEAIPNSGGWLGKIVGENDLGTFAAQFPELGRGLRQFLNHVGTFTEEEITTIKCGADAVKLLAQAANEIPNQGGWVGAICGENSLGTFAAQFPELGKGLRQFLNHVGTFTEEERTTIKFAAEAVTDLAKAADEIPNQGGWVGAICGENNLGTFASQFPELGRGLRQFINHIGVFDSDQLATINCAVRAITAIAKLAEQDLGGFKKDMKPLGKALTSLTDHIKTFATNMSTVTIESLDSAVDKVKKLVEAIKSVTGIDTEAAKSFSDSIKTLGTTAVDDFINAFNGETAQADVSAAVKKLIDSAITAVESKSDAIGKSFTDLAKAAATAMGDNSIKSEFTTVGGAIVDGFVAGINDNSYKATEAGKAIAKAAYNAAKKELDVNSPSKVFRKLGTSVPEGFVMGIEKLSGQVATSASDMAHTAINSTRSVVASIVDAINSDIDSQPTIRPVLDLSDVRAGAGSINALFSGRTLSVDTQGVGVISAAMSRIQNGNNSAAVEAAIRDLRKDLANMSSNTYNINGITYDDGSNINDAVATLVRAARIERRA